jgi:hypothetical protein
VALENLLSNLFQGPSPELVSEPYKQKSLIDFKLAFLLMGFFTSQGMKVKLMVWKDSKQNEQEMLGNKNFYNQCKNQPLFNKKDFFFFSTFLRFHAANIKEFRSICELLIL